MKALRKDDPCWCNSGKKYCDCHMEFDRKLDNFKRKFHKVPPRNIIKNEIPNIVFLNLSQPQIRKIDKIWAEILFGSNSEKYVTEAQRLLRFLANRRNPQ